MIWFFLFFLFSGFCGVLYELVWLRLSMAQFGVTTAMVSIVLSVFMAGLGLGSWASGRWLRQPDLKNDDPKNATPQRPALRFYALIELGIGLSALVVPYFLVWGRRILEHSGMSSSFGFYFVASLWVAVTLLPWCTLMGATVPVAMRAIAQMLPAESSRSFSYLYMANVAGAIAGTTIPLLLIEVLGFHGTLKVGAIFNALIALSAFALSLKPLPQPAAQSTKPAVQSVATSSNAGPSSGDTRILALLFLSGLTCMAMEVIWVRSYTPYFGTVVYAFASILGGYLLATLIGSIVYRRWSSRHGDENPALWSILAACALLPLVAASPAFDLWSPFRLALGIAPFTGLLGFLTPMLVDRFSRGNPGKAGAAYATNVAGCILGPLLAGFVLLPFINERWALILLTAPWLLFGLAPLRPSLKPTPATRQIIYVTLALAAVLIAAGRGYEEAYPERRELRDSTATVLAIGTGRNKQLLVNGYGMTILTPITKVMAHLPLAFLDRPPQNALVICFGMGTTFRSLHSWGIPVTAVELVPSVPRLFDYYHSDGLQVLSSPLSNVVIDDGRRFMERTHEQYDLITIDPPPPVEAAGSSLLYSEEFYQVAKRRLHPGGILQQWVPAAAADVEVGAAVAKSLRNSFPYIRMFWDDFGFHFLCSDQPLPNRTPEELLHRMPAAAITDFAEWAPPAATAEDAVSQKLTTLLKHERPVDQLIAESPRIPALTDDRPINEYFALRHLRQTFLY